MTDTDKVELRLNGDYLTMLFRTNDHMQGVDEAHIIVQFPKDMSSINGDWGGYTWADMTELSVGGANGGTYLELRIWVIVMEVKLVAIMLL